MNFIVSRTSCTLLNITWDESSALCDGTCRLAVGLLSLVETVKKTPPDYGPANTSSTVKSKEGPREIKMQ